uniref:VPS9 domain-containing protein n=1 Tax=Mola mola TaxID=94237 RepID=A0A3Q4BDK7_MOLML
PVSPWTVETQTPSAKMTSNMRSRFHLKNEKLSSDSMQRVGDTQGGSQRPFSILDRLLLTHPVWLQLSLNKDSALYILLREPVGTFLVRKCSSSQRKVLCLRVTADKSASSVKECFICEEDSSEYKTPARSSRYPPDNCVWLLTGFCLVCRDVLPFPLQLPDAIAEATTHRQLEAISHMGQGTLIKSLLAAPVKWMTECTFCLQQQPQLINHSASNKRHRFKRSMRLRLSESSMNLSLEGVGSYSPSSSEERSGGSERLQKPDSNQQRRVHPGAGHRLAPSLAELDSSSSFSSIDEDSDSDSDPGSVVRAQVYPRPPLLRTRGRGGLHRMSEAFVCFFAPDKRLTRLVEELSRDRRSAFGGMVQDFLLAQREVLKSLASSSSPRVTSVQLLQGLRLFLSQAKCCLVDSGELEPPIETLVPENEKDLALERAMFSCVLRPLKSQLDKALVEMHGKDGSTQRLTQNLLRLKGDAAMERLGVRTGVPDSREVERVKQKMALMQRTHSPIDKVLLLLQVCKCVHKAMGEVSCDDFLPSLSYVIAECNKPHILIEVEYMMELLEPSWLGGEGNLKKNIPKCHFISKMTPSYVFTLFCSLSTTSSLPPSLQRCVRILFQDGERSAVQTLQWRAGESSQALAQLCADTFGVSDPQQYTLYWRSGGEMRALPPQAQPQDLASHSEGGPSLSYLRTDHDFSKMRRLTRGGAVDLSESVCEE